MKQIISTDSILIIKVTNTKKYALARVNTQLTNAPNKRMRRLK